MSQDEKDAMPSRSDTGKRVRLPRFSQSVADNARIEPDRRRIVRGDAERRDDERATVDTSASLCLSLQDGTEGRLCNLSASGCCLEIPSGLFNIGDDVWFKIESIQPWKGKVRWISEGQVGVQFERPFFRALFELIVQTNKTVTCAKAA